MKPIRHFLGAALFCALTSVSLAAAPVGKMAPEVIDAMKKVHTGFEGKAGYVAQFGDSITYSMAFWSVMSWDDPASIPAAEDGMPQRPANAFWKDVIKGARDKGTKFANFSGWKAADLLKAVDAVLEREKPEVALIMIGTNDISVGDGPASYKDDLETIVSHCVKAHCIPVLNTIPPRTGREREAEAINKIVREVAADGNFPLVDYHTAILELQPGKAWQGTLISADGVHPTGGKSNDYSEKNLKVSGYALRNRLNYLAYRELYFRVLKAE